MRCARYSGVAVKPAVLINTPLQDNLLYLSVFIRNVYKLQARSKNLLRTCSLTCFVFIYECLLPPNFNSSRYHVVRNLVVDVVRMGLKFIACSSAQLFTVLCICVLHVN